MLLYNVSIYVFTVSFYFAIQRYSVIIVVLYCSISIIKAWAFSYDVVCWVKVCSDRSVYFCEIHSVLL